MTQIEISKYIDIPFATLNDWKKENSNRNKLYQLLLNLDKNLVENILNKHNNHRFFHILNRNSDEKFNYEDIKKAFSKKDYHDGTIKEQTIYSKFYKEIGTEELDDFIKTFCVSKREIKSIYISSPFRKIDGIAKKWDKRFRLVHINSDLKNQNKIPTTLQNILNKKGLTNV